MKPHYYNGIVSLRSFLGAHRTHKLRLTSDEYQQRNSSNCLPRLSVCISPGHPPQEGKREREQHQGAAGARWDQAEVFTAPAVELQQVAGWKRAALLACRGCSSSGTPHPVLLRPPLECWVKFGAPRYTKDIKLLGNIQREATRW